MSYARVPDYSVEFYEPPYDFLADPGSSYPRAPHLKANGGLACCSGCSTSGGSCKGGLGLFDTPLDLETWGVAEYLIAGTVAYTLLSAFFGGRRAVRTVRKTVSQRSAAKRRDAKKQAIEALNKQFGASAF